MIKPGYQEQNLDTLEDFFLFSPVGMHISAPDWRVNRSSLAGLELLGFQDQLDEFVGRDLRQHFSDRGDIEEIQGCLNKVGSINNFKCSLLHRDGTVVRVILDANVRQATPLLEAGLRWFVRPDPARELPSALTVDAYVALQEKVRTSTEEEKKYSFDELNDFFDNAPVGVHFVGLNGVMLRANLAEVKLLGYESKPDAYIGKHVSNLHHDQELIMNLLERLVSGQSVIGQEAFMKRLDEDLVPVHIYSGLRTKDGKFQNTRCFLFENPEPTNPPTRAFQWPPA